MRPRSALARQIKPVAVIPRQMSVSDVAARKKTTNWILLREILISFVFSAVQIHGWPRHVGGLRGRSSWSQQSERTFNL